MDTSRIDEMVDATAAIVAAYVPGIRSVRGVGSGKVTIPSAEGGIMAGQLVEAFSGEPSEPWQHVSNLPAATVTYRTATVTEVLWDVPMRLYVQLSDELELRRRLVPYYAGYFSAFAHHVSLLGTIRSGAIAKLTVAPGSDANWAWLEFHLPLAERLNLENHA